MIAYKQKFININGDAATTIVTGIDGRACAKSLLNFRTKRNLGRATEKECNFDVARDGYKYTLKQQDKAPARKENKLSIAKVINGSKALFDIIKGDVASDQEIKARAAICAQCPLISETSDRCAGCSSNKIFKYARDLAVRYGRNFFIPTIIAEHTRPRKTAPISQFYCGHCGCSCLNLVLSKSKHFLAKEKEPRPENCWVNKNI